VPLSITLIIIVITVLFSLIAFSNKDLFTKLLFSPYLIKESNQYYRFFTYGIIHADWLHLFINMFVLNSFGRIVESEFIQYFPKYGEYYFVLLYVFGIIISVVPSFGKHKENQWYSAVGASGAVSAIVFASIIMHPFDVSITIFPLPIGIPAAVFGILYLIYSAYMGRKGKDNIGHDAHLWGAVFGIAFTIILNPKFLNNFINQISSFF